MQSILSSLGCSEMAVTVACVPRDPLYLSHPICLAIHLSLDRIIWSYNSLFASTADVCMSVCLSVCMSVCVYVSRISREPFIRLTSHLTGVWLGTQGSAVLNLVQFGHNQYQ